MLMHGPGAGDIDMHARDPSAGCRIPWCATEQLRPLLAILVGYHCRLHLNVVYAATHRLARIAHSLTNGLARTLC
jgi:hypothetical protein